MLVGDACIRGADEVGPGIVVAVAGPEACACALVGELAVEIAEACEFHAEGGISLEGGGVSVPEGLLEILLRGERPALGAQARGGGVPCVKAAHGFAVRVVVPVADAGIGGVDVDIFGHPDLSADFRCLVCLFGARERARGCVVGAGVGLFAGGKGEGCRGGERCEGCLYNPVHSNSF